MKTQTLNIPTIRIDGRTQVREQIDLSVVDEYASALAAGDEFPPVSVTYDGTDFWLVDGFHRLHAHIRTGRSSIQANVAIGTARDAILRSLSANITHGLRLSNADKRKAVQTMLADPEWCTWSNRQIAKTCGVSNAYVSQLRNPPVVTFPPPAPVAAPALEPAPAPAPKAGKGTVAEPPAPAPAPAPAPLTDEQQAAADSAEAAFGGVTTIELLEETEAECAKLRALLDAAEEDDQKAATIKWKRIADISQRRQNELMDTVNQRERELKRLKNVVRGVCEAMGTQEHTKVVSMVKAMVNANSATAA